MKNTSPLISVIVPVYQIDKYIGLCIESIINQTYKNLEIILVDDGSTDRSSEICDLYAAKDRRIKVIHKKNGGLVSARKAGIVAAKGDYIGYVDGDDWIGEGFYQAMYSYATASGADVVAAGFSRDLFAKQHCILNAVPAGVYEGETLDNVRKHMISFGEFYRHGITTYLWNKLFKRECIIGRQLAVDEEITIGEDAAVVYPVMSECKKICITDNCAYHYRQREDSMLKQTGDFKGEAYRLKKLYNYMNSSMKEYCDKYNLSEQIKDFITATYIIRSGGYLERNVAGASLLPFDKDPVGKDIVIYGAGTFGQQMKNRAAAASLCNITGWIDTDYWEYRRCCMDVDDVRAVADMNYDYVVIASLDYSYVDWARRTLLDMGVSGERILSVKCDRSKRDRALEYYLSED